MFMYCSRRLPKAEYRPRKGGLTSPRAGIADGSKRIVEGEKRIERDRKGNAIALLSFSGLFFPARGFSPPWRAPGGASLALVAFHEDVDTGAFNAVNQPMQLLDTYIIA